jgi:hypothetical protein
VRAYKFTGHGAVGVFSRFRWPIPIGLSPGAWVEVTDPADVCERGVHACRPADLPYWLAPELWEIELDGPVLDAPYKLVAHRGRLVRRVPGWPELEPPFARACAERVRDLAASRLRLADSEELADAATGAATTADWARVTRAAAKTVPPLAASLAGLALDCFWDIDHGYHAMCAYVAATAFGYASTGDTEQDMSSAGWHEERSRQAIWLVDHLALHGAPERPEPA